MPADKPPIRIYRFVGYELFADDRLLLRDGERVPVTPRVIHVLLVLIENAGRVVSKEALMNEVWADSFVEEGNLNRTVSRLRKILGESANENKFIETIPRVGYRFIADVETVGEEADARTKTGSEKTKVEEPKERNSRRWLIAIAAIIPVAILATLSYWLFVAPKGSTSVVRPPKQTPIRLTNNPTREDGARFTRDGRIRFVRQIGEHFFTHVMEADGSDQRRDVSIAGLRAGTWSPDGKKVVFTKEGDETGAIYLADSDGSDELRLPFSAGNMDWSPDSTKFAYQSGRPNSEIYLYTLATGKIEELVTGPAFDADPSFTPDGKGLVFVSDRDGNPEIYIQDLYGENLRRLTNHPAHDEFPTVSPDGTQIVFNSNREEENYDIYLMNVDGSGVRRLTNWKSVEEIRPGCWSTDGTEIVFLSNNGGKLNVFKMQVEPFAPAEILVETARDLRSPAYSPDGGKLAYIAELEDKTGELRLRDIKTDRDRLLVKMETAEGSPRFSPDGTRIAIQNRMGGNAEIVLVNIETGEVENLTSSPARDIDPAWSPDGNKIVFSSNREGNYDVFSLFTMNSDGTNQHRIYYSSAISGSPYWSPDGRQIVFTNDKEDDRSGNFELFLIEPETVAPEKRLTFRPRYDVQPIFSPDGSRIAFASNTDGNFEIYLMNSDGTGLLRLTRDNGDDMAPSWSPDGHRVVFSSSRTGKYAIYEITVD